MNHELEPTLQRPDLLISEIAPAPGFEVDQADYPWISKSSEVTTSLVTLSDGSQFCYGSIIGLSSSVSKIASGVNNEAAIKADQTMFRALPELISGNLPLSVDAVMNQMTGTNLYKTGKKGPDAARVYFSIERSDKDPLPIILRVAVTRHKEQQKLLGIITNANPQRRRKHDGGGR